MAENKPNYISFYSKELGKHIEYPDTMTPEEAIKLASGGRVGTPSKKRSKPPFTVPAQIDPLIKAASEKYGIQYSLLAANINHESGFNPTAKNPESTASGLMQITKGTRKDLGLNDNDKFNAAKNIDAGARYLKTQYEKFGNWEDALAAYNQGPGAYQNPDGRRYAQTIIKNANAFYQASPNIKATSNITDSSDNDWKGSIGLATNSEIAKRYKDRNEGASDIGKSVGAGAQAFTNTASFGSLPYINALIQTLSGNTPNDGTFLDKLNKNVEIEKGVQELRANDNPISTLAGSVGGLFKGPVKDTTKLIANAGKNSTLAKILSVLGIGGVEGAATTLGVNPNADLKEVGTGAALGSTTSGVLGAVGKGAEKLAINRIEKALGAGSDGLGTKVLDYGVTKSATSLAEKNKKALQITGKSLNDFLESSKAEVQLPKSMTWGDLKSMALDYAEKPGMLDHASNLEAIANAARDTGKITVSQAQYIKQTLGAKIFNEKGLRNTEAAKGLGNLYEDVVGNMQKSMGPDEAAKLQGLYDEYALQKGISNRITKNKYSDNYRMKVEPKLNALDIIASFLHPQAAGALGAYKASSSLPVATSLGAAGRNLKAVLPYLIGAESTAMKKRNNQNR